MRNQTTIGARITILAGGLCALSLLLGVVFLYNLSALTSQVQTLTNDSVPGLEYSSRLQAEILRYRGNSWRLLGATDPKEAASVEQEMKRVEGDMAKAYESYYKAAISVEERGLAEKLGQLIERYREAWGPVAALKHGGKHEEARDKYMVMVHPALTALLEQADAARKFNSDGAQKTMGTAIATASSARVWTWILIAIVQVAAIAVTLVFSRQINQALRQIAGELAEGAAQVASAASQVASSSQALAQGSSEQAASLEETSASAEEINSMSRKNSENSREAAGLVERSRRKIDEANQALDESVTAMDEINQQSDKISKIIKTIDEIAFQTNILALNAAVEAARAGEAGMGFAVVADEVRNLAQRCAQAAKDTAGLIEESIAKSNAGKVKVDQVASAIRAVTEESVRVKTLVDEVNLGSQEQTRGIDQIGKAITQMEQVTQKSAANSEESASAAEELNAQSETLREIVERLTEMVGGAGAAAGPRTVARARVSRVKTPPPAVPHAAARPDREAFPLEEHFKEF